MPGKSPYRKLTYTGLWQFDSSSSALGHRRKAAQPSQLVKDVPPARLGRADCFAFEELGVGSEAEGFQHAGLHFLS